ncbi:MAG: Spy/CpxP family protein refolding chaperone [Gemmatimonadota bacterium]
MSARTVASPGRVAAALPRWTLAAALTALTFPAATAGAQEPNAEPRVRIWHGRLNDPDAVARRLQERVALSDEQRERVRQMAQKFRDEHRTLLRQLEEMRAELRRLTEDGSRPDREKLRELSERYGNPMRELRPGLRELREGVMQLLTPEQRERWKERSRERQGEHRLWKEQNRSGP